ncbi:hypothetical protein PoB_001009700 [Plakobranchus ocellatus]|uniref:Uncharacterized protein n=1 Tax=Plakobranchus ocellatus TaxID=259542 RepID=A0AAV3YMG2_9GAST|nr:hypothetical protein PoB_001009700 [Plakobranchus ocellatus]
MYGFDFALRMVYLGGTHEAFSLRQYGTGLTGITSEGTAGMFLPHGPWGQENVDFADPTNGVFVTNYFDSSNNQMVLEVKFLKMKERSLYGKIVPQWRSGHLVIGLPPVSHGGQRYSDIQLPGLSTMHTAVVRAFESRVRQNQ